MPTIAAVVPMGNERWNSFSPTNTNGLNQLTNVSRTGTLTVAGTLAAPSWSAEVTVSGTGLANHRADLYLDGAWASTNGATLADGMNSFTATVTDGSETSQQTITAFLPASLNFQHDGNGNLTNDGVRVFEYDLENQLIVVSVPAAWRSEFQYDGLGRRRVRKEYSWTGTSWNKTNEVRYIYDGRVVIQERDSNNNPQVTYTRGLDLSGTFQGAGGIGGLLARSVGSSHAYYHSDGNGNVTCMVDGNGQVVARYRYDPYGNLLAMTGPLAAANLYRFSSKEHDPNSGLIYFLYRYYDANLRKWVNRDPVGEMGGMNLYRFAQGNPVSNVDAYGEWVIAIPFLFSFSISSGTAVCAAGSVVAAGSAYGLHSLITAESIPTDLPAGSYYDSRGGNAPPAIIVFSAEYRPHAKPFDAPPGTIPIDRHPGTKDRVHDIKDQLKPDGVGPNSYVGVDPDGHIIVTNPDGTAEDLGHHDCY